MPFLSKILGVGAGQSIETFDLAPWDVAFYDIEGMLFSRIERISSRSGFIQDRA